MKKDILEIVSGVGALTVSVGLVSLLLWLNWVQFAPYFMPHAEDYIKNPSLLRFTQVIFFIRVSFVFLFQKDDSI